MTLVCSFLVAASLAVTASSPPVAATAPVKTTVETLLFATPLDRFITLADSTLHDARLDWASDGCSAPVVHSTGRSFDFTSPCRRHDFGYRNLSRLEGGRYWTGALRRRVDDVFLRDMRAHCALRVASEKVRCRGWALLFYRAVRTYAGP